MRALIVLSLAIVLAGCASQTGPSPAVEATAPTAAPASTASPSGGPSIVLPTTSPSAAPSATPAKAPSAAAVDCILSIPQQVGTDLTPVVIQYPGADEAACAAYLVKQNAGATGWQKDHPATRTGVLPTGKPVCSTTYKGIAYVVWGTTAAQYTCTALGASY